MYPKAVDYVSVLAPSAIHAEFEAPPKCRISLQSPAFSRFQPLKSPTRFHEDPSKYVFEHIRNPFTRSYEYADMPQIEHQSEEDRHRRGTYYAVLKRIEFNKAFFEHVWEI